MSALALGCMRMSFGEVLFGVFGARGKATRPSPVYHGDDRNGKSVSGRLAPAKGTEMTLLAATVVSLVVLAPLCVQAVQGRAASGRDASAVASSADSRSVEITRAGSQPSRSGPAEYFTGSVRVDPLFQPVEPQRASGALVTFEPGARTAWHTHPLGQTLVVTAGCGWVQQWGGPVQMIRPGDVVRIPPGQKHWHGATATTGMAHIAIQEQRDGKTVEWMEKVSDEQYRAGSSAE